MRIVSLKYDLYMYIKDLMNRLNKKGVYKDFNSSNIMVFDNGSISFAIAFTAKSEDNDYGLTLFFGQRGLYSLEDMLTLPKEEINEGDYNLFVLSYKNRLELTKMEANYFKKIGVEPARRNNLTITTYKSGYAPYTSTAAEARDIIKALYLCNKILDDSYEDIKENFKNPAIQSMLVDINMHKHTFNLHFGGLPKFEGIVPEVIPNDEELMLFRDIKQEDYQIDIRTSYATIPVKLKGMNRAVNPLLIAFGWPFSKFDFKYLISNPEEQMQQMLFLLKEFFEKNGLPTKITFNNRDIYNKLNDIFKRFNIECVCNRSIQTDGFFDDINVTLYKVFNTINVDQDFYSVLESDARLSLNAISRVLETINTGNMNLECSEEEKLTITAFVDTIAQQTNSKISTDIIDGLEEEDEEEIERYTKTTDPKLVS